MSDTRFTKRFLVDLAERAIATFVQTFIAVLLASGFGMDGGLDLEAIQLAAVAGLAAVLAVLKGVAASFLGDKDSAAALPISMERPPPETTDEKAPLP